MENNRKLSASCVVFRGDEVLLVKHTYGAAKGKYLIPGGFSEDVELPNKTAEREVLEETGVSVSAKDLLAVRFTTQEVWCIFEGEYIGGEPQSDLEENDDAVFMKIDEAVTSENVVETTRVIIKAVLEKQKQKLQRSSFVNEKFDKDEWQLFL